MDKPPRPAERLSIRTTSATTALSSIASDDQYQEHFDRFEYLLGLTYADLDDRNLGRARRAHRMLRLEMWTLASGKQPVGPY